MDRRQKIMRLIIDMLGENESLHYACNGAVMVEAPALIVLELTASTAGTHGDFSVRGVIDGPLTLTAQYDNRSVLIDYADLRRQIESDLRAVSEKINRMI